MRGGPPGTFALIAREVGCSREWVRQIANEIGLPGRSPEPAPLFGCAECGTPLRPNQYRLALCPACRQITLPCGWCGEPVARDPGVLAHPWRREPHFFCDREHYHLWRRGRELGPRK